MQEGSVTFHVRNLIREPSLVSKLYALFLLIVWVTLFMKLMRVWAVAPPFKKPRLDPASYRNLLSASSASLNRWICAVLLAYGILLSAGLYDFCSGMLSDNQTSAQVIVLTIQHYVAALSGALYTALVIFLARWHLLRRIERLDPVKHETNA